jgi:hypothetical protein
MPRVLGLFLLAAMLAIPSGCGGGEESEPSPGKAREPSTGRPSVRARDYRSRVNRLCRQNEAEAKRIPAPRVAEEIAPSMRRLLSLNERFQRRLERLRPPRVLLRGHREAVRQGREGIVLFSRALADIEEGAAPEKRFRTLLPRLDGLIREGNRLARQMHLPDCVVDPIAPPGAEAPKEAS